jgi:general secretion pathway protein I
VEVIVALAMLALGLGLLLGLMSESLRRTANAERMAQALSLVQSLLARIGPELPVEPGERDGQFPNGYRWHLRMQPYGDTSGREQAPVGLYAISTEVQWDDGSEKRSVALRTLRLGPKAARP